MSSERYVVALVFATVVVSLLGFLFTYYEVSSFGEKGYFTGYAVSSGVVNISINPSVLINFSKAFLQIHNGSVDSGNDNATIDTSGASGGVTRGNFVINATNRYLVIENIGNKNVSMNITSSANAASLIGGTAGGGPQFKLNISNNSTGLACVNSSGGLGIGHGIYNISTWVDLSTTAVQVCDWFNYGVNEDEIRLDVFFAVPSDSKTGNLTATLSTSILEAT